MRSPRFDVLSEHDVFPKNGIDFSDHAREAHATARASGAAGFDDNPRGESPALSTIHRASPGPKTPVNLFCSKDSAARRNQARRAVHNGMRGISTQQQL